MIKPAEIQNVARKAGVRDQQIEKDYILSWILQGISQHRELSRALVFKGGTVLKKVYFEDYRFSEDLDFTLVNETINNDQILQWFNESFECTREEANIPLEILVNEAREGGLNFYISYVGPLGGLGAQKKVKVDISYNEQLVFQPALKNAILGYSDLEEHQLLCYTLEEVLVEKLRSVMQRMQARDFYDIWYLVEVRGLYVDFLFNEFRSKTESKGIDPIEFHTKLEQRLPQYQGRWQSSLANQIRDLPEFDQVEREVMRHLRNFKVG
ncbi:nucleotidyl transferase AbiEii/AbiGii toxin family protein [Reichenbachiella sp.]|uniref:nucleotidyl transferase AbiEii/AbiGii toxin family protein n=1 Tax=Reichenbachiella sp. TaxID=2184521 RepID=UPI003B59B75B